MPRKHQPGCPCCGEVGPPPCNARVCVFPKQCNGTTAISTGTVSVRDPVTDAEVGFDVISGGVGCVGGLEAGTYVLVVAATGRETIRRTVTLTCNTTTNVNVILPATGATRCVIIIGCNNVPIPGAIVTVSGAGWTGTGVTDLDGKWCFEGEPGTYTVEAEYDRFDDLSSSASWLCNSATNRSFVMTEADGYTCCELYPYDCYTPSADPLTLTTNLGSVALGDIFDIDHPSLNLQANGWTHYGWLFPSVSSVPAPTPPGCSRPCPEVAVSASNPILFLYCCRSANTGINRIGTGTPDYTLIFGGPAQALRAANCSFPSTPLIGEEGWVRNGISDPFIKTTNTCIDPLGSPVYRVSNAYRSATSDPTSCLPYHAEGTFTSNPWGFTDWSVDE